MPGGTDMREVNPWTQVALRKGETIRVQWGEKTIEFTAHRDGYYQVGARSVQYVDRLEDEEG